MEITVSVALHKNTPTGEKGGIGHDNKRVMVIREV